MRSTNNPLELRVTRIYDAPVALVWEAWTDLTHVSKWWGPRGFTITTHHKELRVGGTWEYTMHGPDGTDWPNFTRYHEVEPQRRMVYDHGASSADAAPMFRVTTEFRDLGAGRTEVDLRYRFASREAAEGSRAFIKAAGGNSTWDRLAEYLEHEQTAKDVFVIARSFEAPLARMWTLWTDPAHFAQWLPPTGFTMAFRRADIRSGGEAFYSMTNGQFTMYGRVEYLTVRSPDRLQYVQCFANEDESISRHPGAPTWPEKMLTTVLLTAESETQTRVTIRWEPYGSATTEELAAFLAERGGMTKGWTGSFDKLEGALVVSSDATSPPHR